MSSEPEYGIENTEPDNINIGLIATITIVGALLVVSIAAALTALVRTEAARYGDETGAYANLGEVSRLKETQHGRLMEDPKWSDRAKGLASIPIERAMRLVVTDLQRNPNLATPYKPEDEPDAGAPETTGTTGANEQTAPTEGERQTGAADQKGAAPAATAAAPSQGAAPGGAAQAESGSKPGQSAEKGATPTAAQPEAPGPGAAPAPAQPAPTQPAPQPAPPQE